MTARLFESRPNAFYHSYTTPLPLSQSQPHHQINYFNPHQPSSSTSTSPSPFNHHYSPTPRSIPHSNPPQHKPRPKPTKKASSSLKIKSKSLSISNQEAVQQSLEHKVERAKGFHAFFVPLGRGLPAAPPSSPVLRGRGGGVGEGLEGLDALEGFNLNGGRVGGRVDGGVGRGGGDYFGGCWNGTGRGGGSEGKTRDMWVEDVEEESSGMEIDSE